MHQHPIPNRTTQQLAYGHAKGLPDNIGQRDFKGVDRRVVRNRTYRHRLNGADVPDIDHLRVIGQIEPQ